VKKEPLPLYNDLIIVWEAFLALDSSRKNLEAITFSEIEAWLNLNAIFNLDRRQEITHLIRVLDSECLRFVKEKNANIRRSN
jgi:hypothetical protein